LVKLALQRETPIFGKKQAAIELPSGFSPITVPKTGSSFFYATNTTSKTGLMIERREKTTTGDLAGQAIAQIKQFRSNQMPRGQFTPVEALTINGIPAQQFEAHGNVTWGNANSATETIFIHTLLDGWSELLVVTSYASKSQYDSLRELTKTAIATLVGISQKPIKIGVATSPIESPKPVFAAQGKPKVIDVPVDRSAVTSSQTPSKTTAIGPITAVEAERTASEKCLTNLTELPEARILAKKLPIDKKPSFELLADSLKPTTKEKSAISVVVNEWERCLDIAASWRAQQYSPVINGLFNSYWLDLKSMLADLYAGKMSFGEAAKARAKLDIDFKNKLDVAVSEAQEKKIAESKRREEAEALRRSAEARNQQAREAELQRQAQAQRQIEQQEAQLNEMRLQQREAAKSAAFSNAMTLLQAAQPKFTPMLNNNISCSSRMYGGVMRTDCN